MLMLRYIKISAKYHHKQYFDSLVKLNLWGKDERV